MQPAGRPLFGFGSATSGIIQGVHLPAWTVRPLVADSSTRVTALTAGGGDSKAGRVTH